MLLYLHGFESSPASLKIVATEDFLRRQQLPVNMYAPQLPPRMKAIKELIDEVVGGAEPPQAVMGSSLGGFWTHYAVSQLQLRNIPARGVLINPAVHPAELMPAAPTLRQHPYTQEQYTLDKSDQETLVAAEQGLSDQVELLVLLQSGDETLDYRAARERYQHQRMIIEHAGDHSFVNFQRYLPAALEFLHVL